MDTHALITLFIASLVLMIKPGPYMMAFISMSLEGKWRSMLSFWSGYAIIRAGGYFILLSSLSVLPLGTGLVFIFIKSAAAVLFISMGLQSLHQSINQYQESAEELKKQVEKESLVKSFFAGSILCMSNPYDIVFILAAIPSLLNRVDFSLGDINIIHGIVLFSDILVQLSYCLPLLLFRNFLSTDTLKKIKIGSAIALIGIGLYIFSTVIFRGDLEQSNLLNALGVYGVNPHSLDIAS